MASLKKFGMILFALLIFSGWVRSGLAFQPPEPMEIVEPWPIENNVQLLADLKPVPVNGGHSSSLSPAVGDPKIVWSTPPSEKGTAEKQYYDYVIKRLSDFHSRIASKKKQPNSKLDVENRVLISLEEPVFSAYNATIKDPETNVTRKEIRQFFGAQVWVLNNTSESVELDLEKAVLNIEGVSHKPASKIYPISFRYTVNGRTKSSSQLKIHKTLTVEPKGVASSWVFFSNLEDTVENPELKLEIPQINKKPLELDINEFAEASLNMESRLIGPYECLSVIKIAGETNSISMPVLMEKLNELSSDKIARVVIQWEESSRELSFPRVSGSTYIYSRRSAPQGFAQIGSIVSLPQMHVVFPKSWRSSKPSSTSYSSRMSEFTVKTDHKSLEDAVAAALQTAFEILPADKVLEELEEGDILSRRAALLHGSGQISEDDIGLVLDFLKHEKESMRSAALMALGKMGNEEAISTLVKYAKGDDKGLSEVAIASLIQSSHVQAHTEVLRLLDSVSVSLKRDIIDSFAIYPKGIWSEPLERVVLNEKDPKEKANAILSLGVVGSSNLLKILSGFLNDKSDPVVQEAVLGVLIRQNDQQSQQVALDFTIDYLKDSPPTRHMTSLLSMVPDERAITSLLRHFKSGSISSSEMDKVVRLLTDQGDQAILKEVSEQFDSLPRNSKQRLLESLSTRMPDLFRKLAAQVINEKFDSKNSSFYSKVCSLLRQKPGEENARILMQALPDPADKNANTRQASYITNALSMMPSGLVARKALRKLRDESVVPAIATYAGNAVRNLEYNRSPAKDGVNHARARINEGKYDEALKTLDLCEEIDPEMSTLFFERFRALSGKKEFQSALEDISMALSLDPKNSTWLIYKARLLMDMRQFKNAAKEYNQIIALNPNEANYYASRAHAYSMAQMFKEAEADFKKSVKLNPSHPDAITGVALMQAVNGKFDEATGTLAKHRKLFEKSSMFAYNAACVYGRLIDYMDKNPKELDDKKRKEYQKKAIEELKKSAELGYRDWDWMRKDPDLKSISHLPEFNKIPEMDFSKPKPEPKKENQEKTQGVGAIPKDKVFVFGGIPLVR